MLEKKVTEKFMKDVLTDVLKITGKTCGSVRPTRLELAHRNHVN
jgi:hypothetical protein